MRNCNWLAAVFVIAACIATMVTAQDRPKEQATSEQRDPVKIASEKYKVMLDNDRLRVLQVSLRSGEKSPMHAHPEYLVYALSGGKVRFTSADGRSEEAEFKQDQAIMRPAEAHSVENIGGTELRVLNIEFKGRGGGDPAQSAAAAAQVHKHLVLTPQQEKWSDAPAGLPPGAQMMVLTGDPAKPGPFTLRAKLPANYTIQPHWHPADEHVTVLSGTLYMGEGDKVEKSKASALPAGSFTMMPAKMHHFAYSSEPVTLQVHGVGPWGINYINPGDDPRNK